MTEEWKDVTGFEECYEISSRKRVRNMRSGYILEGPRVCLSKPGKRRYVTIDTLVREAFGVPRPVDLEGEVWRDVVGFEGYYEVSNMGRVMRITPGGNTSVGRVKRPHISNGHLMVNLYKNGKAKTTFVHILVLEAFVGPRPSHNHECHHKNENPFDNKLENLEWVTVHKHHQILHPIDVWAPKGA